MGTVKIKMDWSTSLPLLLTLRDTGNKEGKAFANAELKRMAKVADRAVATQPKPRKRTRTVTHSGEGMAEQ